MTSDKITPLPQSAPPVGARHVSPDNLPLHPDGEGLGEGVYRLLADLKTLLEHNAQSPEALKGRASLASKIAAITADLDSVPATGRHDYSKYTYHTPDDITAAIRPLLGKHNLAIIPEIIADSTEAVGSSNKGNTMYRTRVTLEFTIICGDTGATEVRHWIGISDNSDDKGITHAATNAEKNFLIKLFKISTTEGNGNGNKNGRSGGNNNNQRRDNNRDKNSDNSRGQQRNNAPQSGRDNTQSEGDKNSDNNTTNKGLTEEQATILYDMAKGWGYDQNHNEKLWEALSNACDAKAAIRQLSDWPGTLIEGRAAIISHRFNYKIVEIEKFTSSKKDDVWHSIYNACISICQNNADNNDPLPKTRQSLFGEVKPAEESQPAEAGQGAEWSEFDISMLKQYLVNLCIEEEQCLAHYTTKIWAELPERKTVEKDMRDLAIKLQSGLKFERVTYQGQYTIAHVNPASEHPLSVRIYGRDHFRNLPLTTGDETDWSKIVDQWKKEEDYTLPEPLLIQAGKWEAKNGYLAVTAKENALTPLGIPF